MLKNVDSAKNIMLIFSVEDWPVVDCLIAFHSAGFPLNKAIEYQKLR